jgi:hypothetical protein
MESGHWQNRRQRQLGSAEQTPMHSAANDGFPPFVAELIAQT